MARRQPAGRKRRTREHVIADLSVNFVERAALECGYIVERVEQDYGIDLLLATTAARGEIENGRIQVRVKATDTITRTADGQGVTQRVHAGHLKAWLFDKELVVIVVYDARDDVAYWLDVQEYARSTALDIGHVKTVTLRVPVTNRWTPDAVRGLRAAKNALEDLYWRFRDGT